MKVNNQSIILKPEALTRISRNSSKQGLKDVKLDKEFKQKITKQGR